MKKWWRHTETFPLFKMATRENRWNKTLKSHMISIIMCSFFFQQKFKLGLLNMFVQISLPNSTAQLEKFDPTWQER